MRLFPIVLPAALAGLMACQSVTPPPLSAGTTPVILTDGFGYGQTTQFENDTLLVCAVLKNTTRARWLLRAPLAFRPGGQLRVLIGPPTDVLIPPAGPAPDNGDLFTYDILEPESTQHICARYGLPDLPDDPFHVAVLFQPWSRTASPLPARLALQSGIRLIDTDENGLTTPGCEVSKTERRVTC